MTPQNEKATLGGGGLKVNTLFKNNALLDNILARLKQDFVSFTVITSQNPQVLSKKYSLGEDGQLAKETSASMVTGRAAQIYVSSLTVLATELKNLQPNQALCFGRVGGGNTVDLVTSAEWVKLGKPDNPQPRTKDAFQWPTGGGVMLLDYDPHGDEVTSRDALVAGLREAVRGLADVAMLWWPSSSSHIYSGDNDLTGLRGQRLYIFVKNASDIPRAGAALTEYLWATGHGHIMVSRSGAMLERCLVDTSVWQTNRLDFAAGAVCTHPLEQKRGDPFIVPGAVEFVDTLQAIPEPSKETREAASAARARAKLAAKTEADNARELWVCERIDEIVNGDDDDALARARKTAERAIEHHVLTGDFRVKVYSNGIARDYSVSEILDDPVRFHGALTLDPIEPEYLNHKVVGKLYLQTPRPSLYSFAHGGTRYTLMRQPMDIELVQGQTYQATISAIVLLKSAPEIFDFGGQLSLAEGGVLFQLDENHLRHWLGGVCQFWIWKNSAKGKYRLNTDPPSNVCKEILSLGARRGLKPLDAVITAPTLRPDGSLLLRAGYDEGTRLLVELNDDVFVKEKPHLIEVEQAFEKLFHPFEEFPFVSSVDRGVFLASLLTAVIRPTLPTAPAFGFDAPVQASGKTLLAKCVSALSTGRNPTVWPHVSGCNDEELRKRIFTMLRTGDRCFILDNILGIFDSASIAAALTSPTVTDRILGVSSSATLPNRALFILTGNNLTLAGDMPRRVLKCRIDPGTEHPYARRFDLDPLSYVLTNRLDLVCAALTIIRGWLASYDYGAGNFAEGRTASFEQWDDFVRQPVAWLARVLPSLGLADPAEAIREAQSNDPDKVSWHGVLDVLLENFMERRFTTSEILSRMNQNGSSRLRDAFVDLVGDIPRTSKSLGRILANREGLIVGGLCLVGRIEHKTKIWKVVKKG